MGFGVGADVGEAGGIGEAGGLAGVGVSPALALLEFHGVVVEELIDGDAGEQEGPGSAGILPARWINLILAVG